MKHVGVLMALVLVLVMVGCSARFAVKEEALFQPDPIQKEEEVSLELDPVSDGDIVNLALKSDGYGIIKKPPTNPQEPATSTKPATPAAHEFAFTLPIGYVDSEGNLHRNGKMRLATEADEDIAMHHPMVQTNSAYLIIVLLSRVVTELGTLEDINLAVIDDLSSSDLAYLQEFYNTINSQDGAGVESQIYEFTLPLGFVDDDGNLVRDGAMRLATSEDEILPLKDPRVQANPAYLITIILSRVVIRLGDDQDITVSDIERLSSRDYTYLLDLYNKINQ